MKRFKDFFKKYIPIKDFDHYTDFREDSKKKNLKKPSEKIPDFDHYTNFDDRVKKESDNDWSNITRHIHDKSVRDMKIGNKTISPEDSHNGLPLHFNAEEHEDHLSKTGGSHPVDRMLEDMVKHYHKFTPEDKYHIHDYTESSIALNEYLRNRATKKDSKKLDYYEESKKGLLKALGRHEPYEHGHYVWSGIGTKLSGDPMHNAKEHGVTHHNMFLSTSPNAGTAFDFAKSKDNHGHRNLARIYIPGKNERAPRTPKTAYIGHHSTYDDENETLIPPGYVIYHPKPTVIHSEHDVFDKSKPKVYHVYHGLLVPKHVAEEYHRRIQETKG